MKIGVMSDSHENVQAIKKAVKFFNLQGVDTVIHAGDIISPIMVSHFKDLSMEFIGVFGNNDGEKNLWWKRASEFKKPAKLNERYVELDLDQKKFLVIHEPYLIDAYIASDMYDYIIYGHTHKVDLRRVKNTVILNPGEVCGYISQRSTVAIIDTQKDTVTIVDLDTLKTINQI